MAEQTQRTYRDILEPVFGAEALAEAEKRVYATKVRREPGIEHYACADGLCAGAVMARTAGRELLPLSSDCDPRFPPVAALIGDTTGPVSDALDVLIVANDRGELAHAGALTKLLDSPFPDWAS